MSELNITELVNAKVVEFGNERFLEGWKGAEKRIIKLLESVEGTYYEEEGAWSLKDGINLALELIKGENKHTHEIDVFGSPCDCGTRHEYCNNCNWVEFCEIEGEKE
jgi:hypothetical protein